jgi:hypothetical protein
LTSEQLIKQQYVALANVLKAYKTGNVDKTLLQSTIGFCKELYKLAETDPNLVFAQPQLYKQQLPFSLNLTFNSVVLTGLLSIRNRFDPSLTLQLMCGTLSLYAFEQASLNQHNQSKKSIKDSDIGRVNHPFCTTLKTYQQEIWLTIYKMNPIIHLSRHCKINTFKPIQSIAYFANRLALLCTTNQQQNTLNFGNALKSMVMQSTAKNYALLKPLLEYPSCTPPGSFVKDDNNVLSIVLALCDGGCVTKRLPTKQQPSSSAPALDLKITDHNKVSHSYPSQPIKSFSQLSNWWNVELIHWQTNRAEYKNVGPFERLLPVQTPPPSLLVIQDQLQHSKLNVQLIVKAIEKEPAYAQHLVDSASASNRQKQPVRTIQHSLAMLGYERASHNLLQYSLASRLNQQYFPLQQTFLKFNQILGIIAQELAIKTQTVSPHIASTAAGFLLSRLFTLPILRTKQVWETNSLHRYNVDSLVKKAQVGNVKKNAVLLAKAWQQNKNIIDSLERYTDTSPPPNSKLIVEQLSYLLGVSFSMAYEVYFANIEPCSNTNIYQISALKMLGISQQQWSEVKSTLPSKTAVFCQLT